MSYDGARLYKALSGLEYSYSTSSTSPSSRKGLPDFKKIKIAILYELGRYQFFF